MSLPWSLTQIVVAAAFGCGAMLSAHPSAAEGALAVGVPASVAHDGFSYAYSNDKTTTAEASETALSACRTSKAGTPAANKLCRLIRSYHNECVAVAMDPQPGTPGVGWAIAATVRDAEAQALAACEQTAGPGRRAACRIDHSKCDGNAK